MFFLALQFLSFRNIKQTIKNVVETNFKERIQFVTVGNYTFSTREILGSC